ncbi:hypothetical protein DSUL_40101 [Desulfovibrionales bacterium]
MLYRATIPLLSIWFYISVNCAGVITIFSIFSEIRAIEWTAHVYNFMTRHAVSRS